jgi:upstream activation factor subunit UAF30
MVKTTKTTDAKTTKTAAKKAAAATPAPIEVAAPPTPAPVVEEEEVVDTTPTIFDEFSGFMAKLQGLSAQMSALRKEFRLIESHVSKDLKAAAKITAKKKKKSGNRAPSGFVKPTLISNELAGFLGKPVGSEMARTAVTREINTYIRDHKLQDKDNGRNIIADKKLTSLLKLKKDDKLTYFNLQKFMSPHFAKQSDKIATTA